MAYYLSNTLKKSLHKLKKSNTKNNALLLKGSSGGFIVKVVGSIFGFALHILLTREMGASKYGIYMYVLSWLNLISIIGVMGFSTASTRYFAEYISQARWSLFQGYLRFSRRVVLTLSIISVFCFLIASYLLVDVSENPDLFYTFLIGAFALPFLNLINVYTAELKGIRKVIISLVPKNILKQIVMIVTLFILIWYGIDSIKLSAPLVMAIDISSLVICFVYARYYLRKGIPVEAYTKEAKFKRKEWVSTAKDMLLISGFNLLLFQADQLILGILKGTYEVGIYSVISKVALVVVFILSAVNSALSPMIAELYALKKMEKLQSIVRNGANITFAVSTIVVVLIFFLDDILLNVFGDEFIAGKVALWILLFAQLINSYAGPAVMLLNMTGLQKYSAKILAFGAVINVVLNFLLIPKYGVEGAAISTCISMLIWNVMAAYYVREKIGIKSTCSIYKYGNIK